MANVLLKFGNHFLKHTALLVRDVVEGHIYRKKYVSQSADWLYMQLFQPRADIVLSSVLTYDTCSITSSSNGLVILEGDGSTDTSKWKIFASTKNNNQNSIQIETVDGETVYAHRWIFTGSPTMSKDKVYAIQVNFSKYAWSMTQYNYVGTIQDDIEKFGTMICMNSWLSNNGAFRDANIGTPLENIDGVSITKLENQNIAFTVINDSNMMDL